MEDTKVRVILECWGIDLEINPLRDHVWEIGSTYILKEYSNKDEIEKCIQIMHAFTKMGVATSMQIPTIVGEAYTTLDGKWYLMMNKVQGKHITDIYAVDYQRVAFEIGKVLGKIHGAFLLCDEQVSVNENNLLLEMKGWIWDTLQAKDYPYLTKESLEDCINDLEKCYYSLPVQIIHRDFHFENLLFQDGEFTACIDFDLSQKNVRIFDLCYFLDTLLINQEDNLEIVTKWYNIVSEFFKGYETVIALKEEEKESAVIIMASIEALFVAFFVNIEKEELAQVAARLFQFIRENERNIVERIA